MRAQPLAGKTVLVVEDDPVSREALGADQSHDLGFQEVEGGAVEGFGGNRGGGGDPLGVCRHSLETVTLR
jgi:hypothetical protein